MTARVLLLVGALGLIVAARGGSAAPAQPSPQATATASTTPTITATATPQAARSGTPTAQASPTPIPPRTNGLDGAPAPPPRAESAEFDEDRFNASAGAFPPLDDPVHVQAHEAPWLSPTA